MEQNPVPFGDDVGLEVLAALKELGEGLSKLSEIESMSKTGQPTSSSKQFDILQSVNRSIATSRWSEQQQEIQQKQMSQSSPTMTNSEEAGNVLLLKKNSFFVSTETVDTLDVEIEVTSEHSLKEEECDVVVDDSDNRNGDEGDNLSQDLEHEDNNEVNDKQNNDADDDEEEDEWEDDDDLGYVLLKITEEEFFEMEEESSFRHHLSHQNESEMVVQNGTLECTLVDPDDIRIEEININGCVDDSPDKLNDSNVNNKRGSTYHNDLSGSFDDSCDHRNGNDSDQHDDQAPPSPPLDEEGDHDINEDSDVSRIEHMMNGHSEHERNGQSEDSLDDEHEVDIAAVEREMGLNFDDKRNDEDEIDIVEKEKSPKFKGHISRQSRRISEIMGQRKIRGVDGEHCYFDLKVIFDPYRTGFEENKNFEPPPGTIIAGRYEVMEVLGQAAFSTALQCVDLEVAGDGDENERSQWVCLKVIKNSKDFFDQSLDEIKLLQYINSRGDPHKHNVLQMIDYFYCKEHLFIVSELLRENLYEFQKYIRESGGLEYFTPNRLKRIMKQVLEALVYIHSLNLLHCDIKPENIVIKSYSRCDVKLIDFGSSCFVTDHLTSYIQSRSYRAPEVILGMNYNYGIDIWSLGGVLAEMHTAYVLFQNDSIATMLSRIEGILGPYPRHMVETSPESPKYFNLSGMIYERNEEDGTFSLIYSKKTSLRRRLHLPRRGEASEDEELFLEFVNYMLQVDPDKRPSAEQLLNHPWLDGAEELDVYYNIEDANPPLPPEEEVEENEEEEDVTEDCQSYE